MTHHADRRNVELMDVRERTPWNDGRTATDDGLMLQSADHLAETSHTCGSGS
jgi:hypothetical protein